VFRARRGVPYLVALKKSLSVGIWRVPRAKSLNIWAFLIPMIPNVPQVEVKVEKLRGRYAEVRSPTGETVRIHLVDRANYWDAIVVRISPDAIEESYVRLEDAFVDGLDGDAAKKVVRALLLALTKWGVYNRDDVVYYARYKDLDMYYFMSVHLAYVVDGVGDVYEIGMPEDGVTYAKDYFDGEELETIRAFMASLPRRE